MKKLLTQASLFSLLSVYFVVPAQPLLSTELQVDEQEEITKCKTIESARRLDATQHPFGWIEQRMLGENLLCQKKYKEAIAVFKRLIPLSPKYMHHHYLILGNALFEEQGASSEAIAAFHSSLEHDPAYQNQSLETKKSLVHHILAERYQARRNFEKAKSEYKRSLASDSTTFMSHKGLSQVLLAQNKNKAAGEAYEQFIQMNPQYRHKNQSQKDALVQKFLGDHYRASEKKALAIEAYRQATQLDPELVEAYAGLGVMLAQNNQLSDARIAFENEYLALDSYDDTIGNDFKKHTSYTRRVESIGYKSLGYALFEHKNWQGAINAFRRSTELGYDQQSQMPKAFATALIHLNQADEAFTILFNHYDASLLYAQESRKSKESIAYESLSRIYIELDDIASAKQALQKSKSPPSYLGWWLRADNKIEEAIKLYEDYLKNNPPQQSLLIELGKDYGRLKRWNDALVAFHKATQLKSTSVEELDLSQASRQEQESQAYIYLGNVMKEEGLAENGVEAYRQAVQIFPQSPKANYLFTELYGKELWSQGKIEDAIQVYRQYINFNPKASKIHNNLGLLLVEKQQLKEAAVAFQRAIDLAPNFQEAKNNLKHVQEKIES